MTHALRSCKLPKGVVRDAQGFSVRFELRESFNRLLLRNRYIFRRRSLLQELLERSGFRVYGFSSEAEMNEILEVKLFGRLWLKDGSKLDMTGQTLEEVQAVVSVAEIWNVGQEKRSREQKVWAAIGTKVIEFAGLPAVKKLLRHGIQ